MLPELWIVISTVCTHISPNFQTCIQAANIETAMRTPKSGETIYRVIPATMTICDIVGTHDWTYSMDDSFPERNEIRTCKICHKRMKFIQEWVEEK